MIFVDTNVFMYAVGRQHPLREEAREFFRQQAGRDAALCTSAEVMQELLHAYLPVGRCETLDAALSLVHGVAGTIWSVEPEDVSHARGLMDSHPGLGARDLLHLAVCERRGIRQIKSYDRSLMAAAGLS